MSSIDESLPGTPVFSAHCIHFDRSQHPTAAGSAQAQKTTLRQFFPDIEEAVFVPLIKGSANAHAVELEFVGPESGTWSTGVKKYARAAAYELPPEDLKFEFMQLGIVGGPKKVQWDPVRRNVYWQRMTEEETRDKEAKLSIIEERKRAKMEKTDGMVAATELISTLKIP
jgi:hypothetical protein